MNLSDGKTYWDSTYKGKEYPALDTDKECDVLIIGSGSSGAHSAYFLCKTGLKVVLVDKREIASGSTKANTGLLQYSNDKMLTSLIRTFGEKAAVTHYRLCKQAIKKLEEEVVPAIGNLSSFSPRESLYFASNDEDLKSLREEYYTLKKYGFPVEYWEPDQIEAAFGFRKPGAVITEGDAEINPFRHAQALIGYASRNGVEVYGQTRINGRERGDDIEILYTDGGNRIKAKHIIYATGYESQEEKKDPNGIIVSSYALTTNTLKEVPNWPDNMLIWETARPYLYARITEDQRIIIGGMDDIDFSPEDREMKLIHKRQLLMNELLSLFPVLEGKVQPEYFWSAAFGETKDGLPTIGMYDDYPNSYFLKGFGGNGTVCCIILAQIITKLITEGYQEDAWIYMKERLSKPEVQ